MLHHFFRRPSLFEINHPDGGLRIVVNEEQRASDQFVRREERRFEAE